MGLEYDDSVDDWDEEDVTGFPKFQGRKWNGRALLRKIAREEGDELDDEDDEELDDEEFPDCR